MLHSFRVFRCLIFAFVLLALCAAPALADSAPPPPPAGSLQPGEEQTQVRMVWEKVTLKIAEQSAGAQGHAQVTATFNMLNLGKTTEKMEARFPLQTLLDMGTDPNVFECVDVGFPPIADLTVKVDGQPAKIRTETASMTNFHRAKPEDPEKVVEPCWGHFWVTFPPGQDVKIDVTYTTQSGLGKYGPYSAYQPYYYLLQTGAGWKDTIGLAEITVQAPFELNQENLYDAYPVGEGIQFLQGNEVRWRFTSLEPNYGSNIQVTIMEPALWQAIQQARAQVKADPQNGAAWAALAYADHRALLLGDQFDPIPDVLPFNGILRGDEGGQALLKDCQAAYQKAIALQPEATQLRLQYARLSWQQQPGLFSDPALINRAAQQSLEQIRAVLAVDPQNAQARLMLDYIASLPEIDPSLLGTVQPTATTTAEPSPTAAPSLTPVEAKGTPMLSPTQKPTDVPLAAQTSDWINRWLWVGLVVVVIGVVVIGMGVRARGGQ